MYTWRLRDKTDEVVSTISQYAESETVNQTLHYALQGFASCYSAIGDHRYLAIHHNFSYFR
jgi:hypothetical protein